MLNKQMYVHLQNICAVQNIPLVQCITYRVMRIHVYRPTSFVNSVSKQFLKPIMSYKVLAINCLPLIVF